MPEVRLINVDRYAPTAGRPPPSVVMFGDTDVSHATLQARTNLAIGTLGEADLTLDARAPRVDLIDFTSTVVLGALVDGQIHRIFTGLVVSSRTDGNELSIRCLANPALAEPLTGELILNSRGVDAIHAVARAAGLRDDQLDLEGFDDIESDVFEVVAPVTGLSVEEPVVMGPVTFVPAAAIDPVLRYLGSSDVVTKFKAHEVFAVTYTTAGPLFSAHVAGTYRIDAAVAWANVRLRYSLALNPDGTAQDWDRVRLRQSATRVDFVAVRGLRSGRGWLKEEGPPSPVVSPLGHSAGLSAGSALADRRRLAPAAQAISRAITTADPITKVTAISEALEFYAGKTNVDIGFTKAERQAIISVASSFDELKRNRVQNLVGMLNLPPLMARVRRQFEIDGVPILEEEMDRLGQIRGLRNDLVHGKHASADFPEIDAAVALVCRVLLYSAERLRHDGPGIMES